MITAKKPNVPLFISFVRYIFSAGAATMTDFSVLAFFKEIVGLNPVPATFIGACCGATVAFLLGRNWTFLSKDGAVSSQGIKFFFVVIGSILLNTFGEYIFTEVIHIGHYMIARIITAMLVGIGYNFPLQRYFVFK